MDTSLIDSLNNIIDSLKSVSISESSSDNIEVYLAILVTLSTGITVLFNWIFHRVGYKDEYYKKIISKRLSSIEAVEKFLQHFKQKYDVHSNRYYYTIFSNIGSFEEFQKEFDGLVNELLWIPDDLISEFHQLNLYLKDNVLLDFFGMIDRNEYEDHKFILIGCDHHHKFKDFYYKVRAIVYRELQNLYKVNKFLKNKKIPLE